MEHLQWNESFMDAAQPEPHTDGGLWDQGTGHEQVLDSRHTNTGAFEDDYRWL